MESYRVYLVYKKIGKISLRKNNGKVANEYLTQTTILSNLT